MTDHRAFAHSELLDELTSIAAHAGVEILRIRERAFNTRQKEDMTPVTDADHASERIILAGLVRLLPGIPVISEEDHARAPAQQPGSMFVLVDPLDGTREFIAGSDEFTVNIGLIENGVPHTGVIVAPAQNAIWRGAAGRGAHRLRLAPDGTTGSVTAIATRHLPVPQIAVMSRSHLDPATEAFVKLWPEIEGAKTGSSLKFALLAEGKVDIYPRLAPVCEWDIAAGHAIIVAAGGTVLTPEGNQVEYGRADRGFVVPSFVAWANPALV